MTAEATLVYEVVNTVEGRAFQALDELQAVAMSTLAAHTALNQVYTDRELESLAGDERIIKVLVWDDDLLVGFGAITSHLDSLVQFNAGFFRGLFPEESGRGAVWYAIAGLVHPRYWGTRILTTLGDRLSQIIHQHGGEIILWDLVDALHVKQSAWLEMMVDSQFGPGSTHRQIDTQRWMATRLPPYRTDLVVDLGPVSDGVSGSTGADAGHGEPAT
jgi:hypothetical protein